MFRFTHSSSVSASTQAHNSTPVPPSRAPPHGRAPQLSASHLPRLNRKCSSRVFACSKICPSDLGKYLKFFCSNAVKVVLLRKLKEARSDEGGNGRRRSCSWYSEAPTKVRRKLVRSSKDRKTGMAAEQLHWHGSKELHAVDMRLRCCSWVASTSAKPCHRAEIYRLSYFNTSITT